MNEASQEIKVKINESRQLKFYQENLIERKFNWKKIQPRILRKKNPTEDSKIKEPWKFSIKQKKKRKILKFKELCFVDTLSDNFHPNCTKICNTLSFLSLSFLFLCIKYPNKNFIVRVINFEPISVLESCGTYCLNLLFELPFNGTLKPLKTLTS